MHRFFLTDRPLAVGDVVALDPLAHQLHAVLRLAPGDRILLLDGQGQSFPTELVQVSPRRAQGRILARRPASGEPRVELVLFLCSLKRDKFEWVLQKGTELGASRFVPVISQRSVVRPAAALVKKFPRWRTIIREAAEQCGRARLPRLADPVGWAQAVTWAEGPRFLPWEAAAGQEGWPGLGEAVRALRPQPQRLALLVGPEGGISPDEAALARSQGWQPVSLGPRVLRAETAALASLAIVLEALGELG